MSFTSFTVVTRPAATGTGFAASLKRIKGAPAVLTFTLREGVAAALGWGDGDVLAVQLGEEEHHGLVRLKPDAGGSARAVRRVAGGRAAGAYLSVSLGHVPAFVNRAEPKKWCQFEALDDGWVEVVLPSWADDTGIKRTRVALPSAATLMIAPRHGGGLSGRLPGDPPPGRSALDQMGVPPTRGDARRQAEAREAETMADDEAAEAQRMADYADRVADLTRLFGLTRIEALYLDCLLDGRLKSKEALLAAGHEDGAEVEIKIVDVFIHKLRRKLKTRLVEIETVWGQGYRMSAEMIARVGGLLGAAREQERAAS